ncbi:MAG TPA: hypothetical protein VF972_03030, partial [Actinomycetota bacterium]
MNGPKRSSGLRKASGQIVAEPGQRDQLPLGTRPFDRLPSIRAKLGAVIVFAVAVTIAMLYIAIGFALQGNERARQSQLLADETKSLAAFAITPGGKVSPAFRQAVRKERSPVLIVDVFGDRVFGDLPVPPTVGRILAGSPDSGKVPGYEYYGLPIIRNQHLAGGIYLSHPLTGGGIGGASRSAFEFVTRHWWQLLLAGAI